MRFYRPTLGMMSRPSSEIRSEAEQIMRELRKYYIEYGSGLSNHIAWVVLSQLKCNVSVDEVRIRAARYANQKLELCSDFPKSSAVITNDNIDSFVNPYRENMDALTAFFDSEVEKHGIEQSVQKHLPRVTRGCGGAVFHPILQLGLGVESQSPCLVAEGLAYMHARCWREADRQEIDFSSNQNLLETIQQWCEITVATKDSIQSECFDDQYYSPAPDVNKFQLKTIGCLTGLKAFKSPLKLPKEEDIRSELLRMFLFASNVITASGNNFVVVHGLTSLWSCWQMIENVTMPYEQQCEIVGSWMRGFFAAFVCQGLPGFSEVVRVLGCFINNDSSKVIVNSDGIEFNTWNDVINTSIPYDEEHILKAIWMMREMKEHYDDDIANYIFLNTANHLAYDVPKDLVGKPDGNSLTFSSIAPAVTIERVMSQLI